ncbi:putative potassium transporter 17 [Panicum miliaceum]|uniref:Potassium transporter 17 n=1 Tax=Panicum miliaceum TaxID=4540 RepID=A0A3L6PC89_PANMI|nr:putative potassium transporter 17 [Panicum miliaceum]
MTKLIDGGWLPFAVSAVLALAMFGWRYKEAEERRLRHGKWCHRGLPCRNFVGAAGRHRKAAGAVPLLYAAWQDPLNPMLRRYVRTLQVLDRITVFPTVRYRYVQVDRVAAAERLAVRGIGGGAAPVARVYVCTVRYGYADSFAAPADHRGGADDLVAQVVACLKQHVLPNPNDDAGLTAAGRRRGGGGGRRGHVSAGVLHILGRTRLEAEEGARFACGASRFDEFLRICLFSCAFARWG